MTSVIGISCFFHDSAVALVQDGTVVFAIQEERLSRVKHDAGFPSLALDMAVRAAREPIDLVVFYERPDKKMHRILRRATKTGPDGLKGALYTLNAWQTQRSWLEYDIVKGTGVKPRSIHYVDHHVAHASSAVYTTPVIQDGLNFLTIDGVGEASTASSGKFNSNTGHFDIRNELPYPHSLGLVYSTFTEFLGFEVNEGEFKVMGLAAYGKPVYLDRIHQMCSIEDQGTLNVNMDYFSYDKWGAQSWTSRFIELMGIEPRGSGRPFDLARPDDATYADIAASVQQFCEESVVRMGRSSSGGHAENYLAYAGGVALNGLANTRLLLEGGFDDIFIPPAPGDAGGALGAALYGYHNILGRPRNPRNTSLSPYLGREYGDINAAHAAKAAGLQYQLIDESEVSRTAARYLAQGKVIGWHQGRDEFGPRALGNRSILADPRLAKMKDRVNKSVKYREAFRPFAPAFPEELAPQYFLDRAPQSASSRYMLLVSTLTEQGASLFPAVNHFGTARLQSVPASGNPQFSRLLHEFYQETGCPALLNTSFNLKGDPIVSSPTDAIRTFLASGLDALFVGGVIVTKS